MVFSECRSGKNNFCQDSWKDLRQPSLGVPTAFEKSSTLFRKPIDCYRFCKLPNEYFSHLQFCTTPSRIRKDVDCDLKYVVITLEETVRLQSNISIWILPNPLQDITTAIKI